MVYIWPDGTVSDSTISDKSDDYFTVTDTSRNTYDLIVSHLGERMGKDVYFEVCEWLN